MLTQLKIDFHGIEPSPFLRKMIQEQAAALEKIFGRMTACHVGVRTPGKRHRTGGLYHIDIHVTLPDGREVAVGRTPPADERHADPLFAVTDAFRRARRQLQDKVRRMQGAVKTRQGPPTGAVLRFDAKKGYGFIQADGGREIYFHRNAVIGDPRRKLTPGTQVTFVETNGEKGPQASTVHVLGKHRMRPSPTA